jgi:hypothetical protein
MHALKQAVFSVSSMFLRQPGYPSVGPVALCPPITRGLPFRKLFSLFVQSLHTLSYLASIWSVFQMSHDYQPARKQRGCQVIVRAVHYFSTFQCDRSFQMLHVYQPARKQRGCQVIVRAVHYFSTFQCDRSFQMLHVYQTARKQRGCQVIVRVVHYFSTCQCDRSFQMLHV